MALWAHACRYHLPTSPYLPRTPEERGQNSDMSLWKLCPTLDYTWSKNYELHLMSLETETTLFLSPKQQSQKVLRDGPRGHPNL